jgi:hypothetical protein
VSAADLGVRLSTAQPLHNLLPVALYSDVPEGVLSTPIYSRAFPLVASAHERAPPGTRLVPAIS